MDWTPAALDQLRALAMAGRSYEFIAAQLGCTKNAVVGKAHRLGLPKRPSPIGASVVTGRPAKARPAPKPAAEARPKSEADRRAAMPTPPLARVTAPGAHRACQWIEGPPRGAATLFCGAATAPGSSFCAVHHARCWRPRDAAA